MNPDCVLEDSTSAPRRRAASLSGQVWLELALVSAIGLLWLQLYYSVTPVWIYGDYYDYGWFVPPIAGFFFFRRWHERSESEGRLIGQREILILASFLFPFLICIRALEGFDPTWRPPMMLHAAILALLTHWVVWRQWGRALSIGMIPVTIFALSAVPYPYRLEHVVIQALTEWVVHASGALFQLFGRPVLVNGGVIELGGIKVEVTDGCSGIQSLQSLIMVSLYFGEFFRLRIAQRFFLIGAAVVLALTVNVGRAIYLARIRFDQGEAAFDSAHDMVGHFAFATGGLGLLLIARVVLARGAGKRKVSRRSLKKSS